VRRACIRAETGQSQLMGAALKSAATRRRPRRVSTQPMHSIPPSGARPVAAQVAVVSM